MTSLKRSVAIGGLAVVLVTGAAAAQEPSGNVFNPDGIRPSVETDPDGMGITEHPRTPTGRLHESPRVVVEPRETTGGWLVAAHVEAGAIVSGGDTDNAKFREYRDLDAGAYLNSFAVSFEKPDTARFIHASGAAIGRDDQFLQVDGGRWNAWRIRGFLTGTPHVFTSTYRSLWTGIGTDTLRLASLTPGGTIDAATTQTAIQAVLAETPYSDLGLTRTRTGARFDLRLPRSTTFFASVANEQRTGSRPFGLVFGGGGGGGNTEPPESIDASTTDFSTGMSFGRGDTLLNLAGTVSLFRNDIDTLTIENPLFVNLNTITGILPTSVTSARYDLHPNNTYQNVRAELARRWPSLAGSRLTGVVSVARYRQNDDLIPWTASSLTGGVINGVPATDVWNTTAALTKTTADATIDTLLVDVGWSLTPVRSLDLRAKLRVFDTDNDTTFVACNPLTGQWGRLINDGSGGSFVVPHATPGNNLPGTPATAYNATGCNYALTRGLGLVPSAGNVNLRNVPYAYRQTNASVTASYRLTRRDVVETGYERESFDREYREREQTWEDRVRVSYVSRQLLSGTFRGSYTYARRRGSDYDTHATGEFVSGALGPLPTAAGTNVAGWIHAVAQLRKFDLADRDRHLVDARFNMAVAPTVDASVALQMRDATYPTSMFGRIDRQQQVSPTVDITWQPSPMLSVAAFGSWHRGRMNQAGVHPLGCVIGTSYFFFSNGLAVASATGDAPPTPPGASLVGVEQVGATSWETLCGASSDTSPAFPRSRIWTSYQRDRNTVVGGSAYYSAGRLTASAGYSYNRGRTRIDYDYNPVALGIPDDQAALAGTGWPELVFDQHFFDADVSVPVRPWIAAHVVYRYEHGRIDDWHYDGVDVNPMPAANAAYLDAGPRGYGVHVAGIFVRVSLR